MNSRPHWYRLILSLLFGIGVLLLAFNTPSSRASTLWQADPPGEGEVLYLPKVQADGPDQATPAPTSEPTETPEPTPEPTSEPTPTSTPDLRIDTVAGACPADYHLIHETGATGMIDPDDSEEDTDWSEYACWPDETLEAAACSAQGTASLLGGVAACSCAEGYAGPQCNICAWGYARETAGGPCMPKAGAQPVAQIEGASHSVEYGDVTVLHAMEPIPEKAAEHTQVSATENAAPGQTISGVWTIAGGNGCLVAFQASQTCVEQVSGDTAFFRAPDSGDGLEVTTVQFVADCCDGPPVLQPVMAQPPGHIPISGWGDPDLEPILEEVLDFMVDNCVGAATVGVSYYGAPVGMWGLGKLYGRASSAILDPLCGNNLDDPHYPEQPNITPDTPMVIGSVSKVFTYSIARWILKNRLKALDTDVATVALSDEQLVTAIRTEGNQLQLDSWTINSGGITQHLDEDLAGQVRDLSLACVSSSRVVAAVRALNNDLRLIVWQVGNDGELVRLGDADAGPIKEVQMAPAGNDRVVTAVRTADDRLRLIVWRVLGNGNLERLSDATTGKARDVAISELLGDYPAHVVTAVRTEQNKLKMIVWEIDADGAITRDGDHEVAGQIGGVQVATLTPNRVVVAAETSTQKLKVMVWDINENGNPVLRGSEETGEVTSFALTPIGPSGFATGVGTVVGDFKLITWHIEGAGDPVRRGDADAGAVSSMALANVIYGNDTFTSIVFAALRAGAGQLKLIAWNATPLNPQRQTHDINGDPIVDFDWSDADIEALPFLGYDIPEGLMPHALHRLFAREDEAPVKLGDSKGTASCPAPEQFADPQWGDLTLKYFFGHRTGMTKSAPDQDKIMRDYLDVLRHLETQADYAAQEALMRATWGEGYIEGAREALGWDAALVQNGDTGGYLIPFVTEQEIISVVAGRCLLNDLTRGRYSNTTPQFMRIMMEHISGQAYSAEVGFPNTHNGSLIDQFFAAQPVEIESQPLSGIFLRPRAPGAAGQELYPGAIGRDWNGSTYYPTTGDIKRPHCVWQDDQCRFNQWVNGTRLNWMGDLDPVPIYLAKPGTAAHTGGLAVEVAPMLAFLAHYWAAGYDSDQPEATFNPWVGQPRNNVWNIFSGHNGSTVDGKARVHQIADSGRDIYGVDVFVAHNQKESKRCPKNDPEPEPGCNDHLYNRVIKPGVNAVDWSQVTPPFILPEAAP